DPRDELRARGGEHGVLPRRRRHPRAGPARRHLLLAARAEDTRVPRARAGGGQAVRGFRGASKAPLAVAAILAAPLFFVALMAFSLKFDKPSYVLGKPGDPTTETIGTIYLATFSVAGALVLVGVLSMLLRS